MVGTRSPSQGWASTPRRSLPTFTTVDHHYHREKNRWMLGIEKLASLGFPVRDDISKIYGVDLRKLIIDYCFCSFFLAAGFPNSDNDNPKSVVWAMLALQHCKYLIRSAPKSGDNGLQGLAEGPRKSWEHPTFAAVCGLTHWHMPWPTMTTYCTALMTALLYELEWSMFHALLFPE